MSNEEKQSVQGQDDEQLAGMDTFFAESSPKQEKPAKTGGMSKTTKGLIAGIAVLVVLGGGLTAALLLRDQDSGSSGSNNSTGDQQTTEAQELIPLNESLAEDVTQVEVKGKDNFTMFRVSEKTDEASAVYSVKGMEELPLSNNLLSTLANNASELYAYDLVEENAEDLDKYGLAKPDAQITMQYEDGTSFSMSIGMESPLDTVYSYALVGQNVYLVKSSPMENYRKEKTFFLSTTVLEEPAEDDYPIVESVRVQREDLDYDIYLEYEYEEEDDDSQGGAIATHVMREPVFAYLTPDKSTDVTNGMFGLYATEIVAAHPTDAELENAGILEPFCTVTMKCDNGKTYSLYFGDTYKTESGDQECYYAYLDGVDVLYGVSADNAVWATVKPGEIVSENILNTYVWDIATLDVTANGKKISFVGEGDKDSYEVKKDGTVCDNERFRLFYRFLLYIYGEELYLDGEIPDRAADSTIHVVTQDGSEDVLVEFYRLDNLTALVVINGQPTFKTRASSIDAIEDNIELFDTSEEFITVWR